jgi:two-component system sensor kinase FixL
VRVREANDQPAGGSDVSLHPNPAAAEMVVELPVPAGGTAGKVLQLHLQQPALAGLLELPNSTLQGLLIDRDGNVVSAGGNALPPDEIQVLRSASLHMAESPGSHDVVEQWSMSIAVARPQHARDWLTVVVAPHAGWGVPLQGQVLPWAGAFMAVLAIGLVASAREASRLGRPLQTLTRNADLVAAGGDAPLASTISPPNVREFEALLISLARADAVLRDRAEAERQALRLARNDHELLSSVMNATPDPIHVTDCADRFVLVNRAALLLHGAGTQQNTIVGRKPVDVFGAEVGGMLTEVARQVMASGRAQVKELRFGRRSFIVNTAPWRDASGRVAGTISVSHDVTEARAAEARLNQVQADLLRASRLSALGVMASGLAHEINQPLSAATNFLNAASRLLRTAPERSETLATAREAVVDAAAQTLRAGDIVHRLRRFVERGEPELRREDVVDLLDEACSVARADRAAGSAQLMMQVAPRIGEAMVDRIQIQQVVLNLIRNAGDALAGRMNGRIEVTANRAPADTVEIAVADNGPGLAPEVAGRLFEPFVSTKNDGLGIGLAICRAIVEGHGGVLDSAPNPGGGTIFRILLPLAGPPCPRANTVSRLEPQPEGGA